MNTIIVNGINVTEELEKLKELHIKQTELLNLYRNFHYHLYEGNLAPRVRINEKIQKLEKELEELK